MAGSTIEQSDLSLEFLPDLKKPVVVAGFSGWGNALDVCSTLIDFLVRRLDARCFARLQPDSFFRYDDARPWVLVQKGALKHLKPSAGAFHFARSSGGGRDLVLLKSDEPDFNWVRFADTILNLAQKLGAQKLITVGSLLDAVLPSERAVSAIASDGGFFNDPRAGGIHPIDYQGPGAVHSVIHHRAMAKGLDCLSLWCHCPYYLRGVTDFGALNHLCEVLSRLLELDLEFSEITQKWKKLLSKILTLIEGSGELKTLVADIQRAKIKEKHDRIVSRTGDDENVIDLSAFFDSPS